jgi:cytochrome c oxidase assembly protein subunit 15
MSQQLYIKYTKFLVLMVFLVIIAGSVVRTTQSGMGCPDWPKCFGKFVPPTNAKDLPADYQKYLSKQNIDVEYNPVHAWIEWLNRMVTGVLGIFLLIHVIWSYKLYYKTNRKIFWWSFALILITIFEAWLGKTVVDSNLAVVKITLHMLLALGLAAIPVVILNVLNLQEPIKHSSLKISSTVVLILLLIQIIFGTEVREQIDVVSKLLNYQQRELWIEQLDIWFIIHRSFSWVVAVGIIAMYLQSAKIKSIKNYALFNAIMVLLLITIGVIMAYANIPAIAQPLHLLISSVLVISLFSFRLKLS